jgi:hemoglobin
MISDLLLAVRVHLPPMVVFTVAVSVFQGLFLYNYFFRSERNKTPEQADGTSSKPYLLDRMGGDAALDAAVDGFYDRVLADKKLKAFFKGADVNKLKNHQRRFLKMAFTKIPSTYNVPKIMLDKHQKLFEIGLNENHFDIVAGHLVDTLLSLGVTQDCVDEAVSIVGPLRSVFEEGAAVVLANTKPIYLLDRMGGDVALDAAVGGFYDRVLNDEQLEVFFAGADVKKLKAHQRRFLKMAFTKIPSTYNVPKIMLDKHERLFAMGLNGLHFDIVAAHLVATLASLGVSQDCINEAVAIIGPLRAVFEQGAAMAAN